MTTSTDQKPAEQRGLHPFYVTFGQKYVVETHPAGAWVHPNGYLVIWAKDEDQARAEARRLLGSRWAFLYSEQPDHHMYPAGALHEVVASDD